MKQSPLGQVCDSREFLERISYLEELSKEDLNNEEEYDNELQELNEILDEVGLSQFQFGVTFIRNDYWHDYCQELAFDTGQVSNEGIFWNYVDWDKWADDMSMDYQIVTLNNNDFYFRL